MDIEKPHKLWMDQCEATLNIHEQYGSKSALGYLIGEKFYYFVQMADQNDDFKKELPKFVDKIKEIFDPWEIRSYLENITRFGALGHVMSDEQYEEAGHKMDPDADNAVKGAEDVLILEKIKSHLLTG